jgi:hypothetical protein
MNTTFHYKGNGNGFIKTRQNIPLSLTSNDPCFAVSSGSIFLKPEKRLLLENTCNDYLFDGGDVDMFSLLHLWIRVLCPHLPPHQLFVPSYIIADSNMLSHIEFITGQTMFSNIQSDLVNLSQSIVKSLMTSFSHEPSVFSSEGENQSNLTEHIEDLNIQMPRAPVHSSDIRARNVIQMNMGKIHAKMLAIVQKSPYCQDLICHIQNVANTFFSSLKTGYEVNEDNVIEPFSESFYNTTSSQNSIANVSLPSPLIFDHLPPNQNVPTLSFQHYHKKQLFHSIYELLHHNINNEPPVTGQGQENLMLKQCGGIQSTLFLIHANPDTRKVFFVPFFGNLAQYHSLFARLESNNPQAPFKSDSLFNISLPSLLEIVGIKVIKQISKKEDIVNDGMEENESSYDSSDSPQSSSPQDPSFLHILQNQDLLVMNDNEEEEAMILPPTPSVSPSMTQAIGLKDYFLSSKGNAECVGSSRKRCYGEISMDIDENEEAGNNHQNQYPHANVNGGGEHEYEERRILKRGKYH